MPKYVFISKKLMKVDNKLTPEFPKNNFFFKLKARSTVRVKAISRRMKNSSLVLKNI